MVAIFHLPLQIHAVCLSPSALWLSHHRDSKELAVLSFWLGLAKWRHSWRSLGRRKERLEYLFPSFPYPSHWVQVLGRDDSFLIPALMHLPGCAPQPCSHLWKQSLHTVPWRPLPILLNLGVLPTSYCDSDWYKIGILSLLSVLQLFLQGLFFCPMTLFLVSLPY